MLLQENDQTVLRKEFSGMTRQVKLLVFTRQADCDYCDDTKAILNEIAGLSDRIDVEEVRMDIDSEAARRHGVDKAPAIVVADADGKAAGVVFYGIPAGYEFMSLIGAIQDQGTGRTDLSADIVAAVKAIDKPVDLKVFVTPTCPHCPRAVRVAHMMAFENPNIRAECIEATEFPELSRRFQVMGVPRTVINEKTFLEGAYPEAAVLKKIQESVAAGDANRIVLN